MFKIKKGIVFGLLVITTLSCAKKEEKTYNNDDALFVLREDTGIDFSNNLKNIDGFNVFSYRNFYNGGGVAIADINNDGLSDVYLTSNMEENKLFLNKGNFQFEDITESSKTGGKKAWSTGVVMVDINHDRLLDIYVCNAGNIEGDDQKNELFINNGDLTFTEKAEEYGLADNGFTTHAAFFDYDLDGDLDVYMLNNSFIPVSTLGYNNKRELREENWQIDEKYKGGGDKLYENRNGKFVDVSESAGIYSSLIGFGLGVTIGDVNRDLFPDIFISNDFYERDYLYINRGDGTFSEEGKDWIEHMSMSSMGADMADINNDGLPEIFTTDMLPEFDERLKTTSEFENYDLHKLKLNRDFHQQYMQNTLQFNNGDNTFSEIGFQAGVAETDWSWGALLVDLDNDGFKDIYVSNGIFHDLTNQDFIDFFANDIIRNMTVKEIEADKKKVIDEMPSTPIPNYILKNNGDLTFQNVAKSWGMDIPSFSNGASYGDLDNDGDLDLIVNNVNQKLFVFENKSNEKYKRNFVKVNVVGDSINTYGIGSLILLHAGENIYRQELIPSRGFQSSIDYKLVFGLAEIDKVDSIEVFRPDRHRVVIKEIPLNEEFKIDLNLLATSDKPVSKERIKPIFKEVQGTFDSHLENDYVDFDYEGLIPKMLSREGPTFALADVNNDGREDIFVGGASGQSARIYLQNADGTYSSVEQTAFANHAVFEDTASAFFDADQDGDQDLYVGSGGNNVLERKEYFNDRIYFNDGQGNFEFQQSSFTPVQLNTAVVAPCDFDSDGDIDLFIGHRSIPGIYGVDPENLLFENDGKGKFVDVIESKAFDLKKVGMITNAVWIDMNQDEKADLVIAGEWMAPMIFENSGRRLKKIKSNLSELTGLWTALDVCDLDGDGKLDLVLGNKGTNWFYETSKENPAKMYINDFDNNGTIEQILTRNINRKDMPVVLRKELSKQIPSLKKTVLKFEDYAKTDINGLFNEKIIENSIVKSVMTFESVIAYNNGDNNFAIESLPNRIQRSSVNAILTKDLNGDGVLDIITAGNDFRYKPQFSRSDASTGDVIMSQSARKYSCANSQYSGFFIRGQASQMRWLKNNFHPDLFIVGLNDNTPQLFELND
ncbi:VCBS repeat-containing protein [Namhaeicola litoreus]|uniref:VCBS repeat-containing protein n=1 Tax=Namhaeicola litoreus TaxID=1052145 RepID=A0ABW3XY08_9FLAO